MPTKLDKLKNIGSKIGLNDDKGYAVAIFLALIIISSLLVGYYVLFKPAPVGYNTIYLLDSQNKATNYPNLLISNVNSTFTVPVTVENHMGTTTQYEVLVKITNNLSTFPVNAQPIETYQMSLRDGQSWQKPVTVTENQVGSYSVVFELWEYKPDSGTYQFTYDYCVLNIQVVAS
jgi:uncharacterized membrane protein